VQLSMLMTGVGAYSHKIRASFPPLLHPLIIGLVANRVTKALADLKS
jgi:hypothetical protein